MSVQQGRQASCTGKGHLEESSLKKHRHVVSDHIINFAVLGLLLLLVFLSCSRNKLVGMHNVFFKISSSTVYSKSF